MLQHLVIFLPGIMGSILRKDDRDVWAPSGQALWTLLDTQGESIQGLRVASDDGQTEDLEDGIQADRLVRGVLQVPRLMEHSGYGPLLDRLPEFLEIAIGSIHAPRDEDSFFPFPYDWRRDNRVSARRLQRFIDTQLPRWQRYSGARHPKVILIGHSMGGLVARYYVEVLGGWKNTLALLTVGTPHRGALGALDMLSNGIPKLERVFDLGPLARSFESLYQLLPTYRAIQVKDAFARVVETVRLPQIDQTRAHAASRDFHEAMRLARKAHLNETGYDRYHLLPWIGVQQETLQSARFAGGRVSVDYVAPTGLPPELNDGDGTVPRISAVPAELEGARLERFVSERHGWLTNNEMCLEPLLQTVRQLDSGITSSDFYGSVGQATATTLGLRLEGLFERNERPTARLRLYGARREMSVRADVRPTSTSAAGKQQIVSLQPHEATDVVFEGLAPGQYVLTVRSSESVGAGPHPVHGVFEVLP